MLCWQDLIVPQKRSLRPTSPTFESAFRRHVVNRPPSPGAPRRKASLALSPSNSVTVHFHSLGHWTAWSCVLSSVRGSRVRARRAKLHSFATPPLLACRLSMRSRVIERERERERERESTISAKVVSLLAVSARIPGSNPTVDGYFSTSLKAL